MKDSLIIKLLIYFVLALLLGIVLTKIACATGEYPVKTQWWFVTFNPNCATDSTWKILARSNYWEGAGDCAGYYYIDSAFGRNSNLKWTSYLSILDGHQKGTAPANWYEAQFDSESCGSFCEESLYYHYWNNTTVAGKSITGWKNLSDDSTKYKSRVPFAIDTTRYVRNTTNAQSRKITVKFIIKTQMDSIKTASNNYVDGLFLDNGGYTGVTTWFQLEAGETLYESHSGVKIVNKDTLASHEWVLGRHILYRTLFDTLYKNGQLWSKDTTKLVIELNVGGDWRGDYYKDSLCNRTDNEGLHNPFGIADNGSGRPYHIAKKMDSIQTQAYPINYEWEVGEGTVYMPASGSGYTDTLLTIALFAGLPTVVARDQIWLDNLAFFYAVRRESTSFRNRFAGTVASAAGWDSLGWHPLYDTLERFTYPLDTIKNVAYALDSLGDSVGIWLRKWTNGQSGTDTLLAYVRCRHLYNQTAGQNTAYTFNLPSTGWKAMDLHGRQGTAISTAWLRNGQGAFFIKYGTAEQSTGKKLIRGRLKKQ